MLQSDELITAAIVCAYHMPIIAVKIKEPLYYEDEPIFSIPEDTVKDNLEFLSNQEVIDVSDKEIHGDNTIAWDHFLEFLKLPPSLKKLRLHLLTASLACLHQD